MFVSSLISGMEPIRAAARTAVETLRHTPVMAEDFGAQPASPQVACLTGLREADLVLLILGARYGAVQASGLSATHEEYREAKERKPVIAFVQEGVDREPRQAAFVEEVQGWSGGLFRAGFCDAADLQTAVTRALYDYALSTATGPVDDADLTKRAVAALPAAPRSSSSGSPVLRLALVGGPQQQLLRPVEIERPELREALHQSALFGAARIFDPGRGVTPQIVGSSLKLAQERGSQVELDQRGEFRLTLLLERERSAGMPVLLQEDVQTALDTGLAYAAAVVDRVDPTDRLVRMAVAVRIDGGEYQAWRTRAEHDASPNSVSLGHSAGAEHGPETLVMTRAALRMNRAHAVEDLLVPLRRQWRTEGATRPRGGIRFV